MLVIVLVSRDTMLNKAGKVLYTHVLILKRGPGELEETLI